MPRIANVVGARPQFVKAGPVSRELAAVGIKELLVHTGQHYDPLMSERIMSDIGLREPDVNLGVGSGSHARQTARTLEAVESVLTEERVDAVITYGDTNSTVATALAAAKLGIPIAHVEAGLRSFNRSMPEEINRVVTDHLSSALFAPTQTAMSNLHREGLAANATLTGDVMVDALRSVDFGEVPLPEWAVGDYFVATIHRAENTDDEGRLGLIIASLSALDIPVHLIAHPRLRERLATMPSGDSGILVVHEPLPYASMLATVRASRGLFTDSGGLQKEAFILRVPCVTIRDETEWPETLTGSWNVLARPGADLYELLKRDIAPSDDNPFGDGQAAMRVVDALLKTLVVAPST